MNTVAGNGSPLGAVANLAAQVLLDPVEAPLHALSFAAQELSAASRPPTHQEISNCRLIQGLHAPLGRLRNREFIAALQEADPDRYQKLRDFYNEEKHPGCRFILPVDHPSWECFGGDFSFNGRYDFSLADMQRTVMQALAPHTGGNIISVRDLLGRRRLENNQYVCFGDIEKEMRTQCGEESAQQRSWIFKNFSNAIFLEPKLKESLLGDQFLVAQWNSLANPDGSFENPLSGSMTLRNAGEDYYFDMAQLAHDIPEIKVLKVAGMWDPKLPQTHLTLLEFMDREITSAHVHGILAFAENLPPSTMGGVANQTSFASDAEREAYLRSHSQWMMDIAVTFTQEAAAFGLDADMHKALLPNTLATNQKGDSDLISREMRQVYAHAMSLAAWRPIGWMSAGVPDLAAAVYDFNANLGEEGDHVLQGGYFPGRGVFLGTLQALHREILLGDYPKSVSELESLIRARLAGEGSRPRVTINALYETMAQMGINFN